MRGVVAFYLIHWCLDMELDLRPAVILMFYFFLSGNTRFLVVVREYNTNGS